MARSALHSSEAYLAEAQRLSRTGSFGWNVSSGEIFWSEETYKIFEFDRAVKPTLEFVLQRIHPDDRDRVQHALDHATNEKTDFDIEHRLLMPDSSVKHVHALARALETSSGNLEYVGCPYQKLHRPTSSEVGSATCPSRPGSNLERRASFRKKLNFA